MKKFLQIFLGILTAIGGFVDIGDLYLILLTVVAIVAIPLMIATKAGA